jgi:hypothetical protein
MFNWMFSVLPTGKPGATWKHEMVKTCELYQNVGADYMKDAVSGKPGTGRKMGDFRFR